MPAGEIAIGITGLRAALDLTKAMIGLRDAEAFRAKSIELQGIILETMDEAIKAREAHSAQIDRIGQLEKEVARLKAWDGEKEKYQLKRVGISGLVRMLKPDERGSEDPHWLCPNCFEHGEKSYFQKGPAGHLFICPSCKANFVCHGAVNWG